MPARKEVTKHGSLNHILNPQKLLFVQEYLVDHNPRKAAIRAGYAIHSASVTGSRLMREPLVAAAIEDEQLARADRMGITKDRILQELALIGFGNVKNFIKQDAEGQDTTVPINDLTHEDTAPLTEYSVETTGGKIKTKRVRIKMADKRAALVDMGKHLGMFKEKIEVTGKLTLEDLVKQSLEEPTETEEPLDAS